MRIFALGFKMFCDMKEINYKEMKFNQRTLAVKEDLILLSNKEHE